MALPCLNPFPMWQALLDDLKMETSTAVIALRFHRGLAQGLPGICPTSTKNQKKNCSSVKQVVLSGGVFQNELLAQLLETQLQEQGLFRTQTCKNPL